MLFYPCYVVTPLTARDPKVGPEVDSASSFSDAEIFRHSHSVPALTPLSHRTGCLWPRRTAEVTDMAPAHCWAWSSSVRPGLGTIGPSVPSVAVLSFRAKFCSALKTTQIQWLRYDGAFSSSIRKEQKCLVQSWCGEFHSAESGFSYHFAPQNKQPGAMAPPH